jgi:hypothetical protein
MSWLFSQALVAEYSAANYSAGALSAPSKLTPTPQAYLSPDKMTAFSRPSRFGMTFAPLMAANGEALLTWFQAVSRAKISASQGQARALTGHAAASGWKWPGSLAKFDPDTSSWKTRQLSLLGDWAQYSETFPKWGSMQDGELLPPPTPAPLTCARESGLWPTPVCMYTRENWSADRIEKKRQEVKASTLAKGVHQTGNGFGMNLAQAARLWPTPTASLGTNGGRVTPRKSREGGNLIEAVANRAWPTPQASDANKWSNQTLQDRIAKRQQVRLNTAVAPDGGQGGQLNPTWVEWLMGWPLGWTDLKPLETGRFRQWLRSHGGF